MLNNKSLRWKINLASLIILLIITLIFGVVLSIYENSRRNDAIAQITQSLEDLTRQYSEQLGNEIFALQELATEQTLAEVGKRRNILTITTYDDDGQSFVSSSQFPMGAISFDQIKIYKIPEVTLQSWRGETVLNYLSPITAYGETVGYWQIFYDLTTLNHQTLEIIAIFIALVLSLYFLLGLLLNKLLQRLVLEPVHALQDAMKAIEHGDTEESSSSLSRKKTISFARMVSSFDRLTEPLIVSSSAKDEIGSLAYAFRQMLISLKKAYSGIRTDPLTQLNNRLKLDESLEIALEQAKTHGISISVILLDIDNFKKINDGFGHLIGDEVLKQLARLLENNLRQDDTPGRWGGEEFLIVLMNKDCENAAIVAEKLRKIIADETFPSVGRVTASFGISGYVFDDSSETLVKRADDALYRAKTQGKNRVVVF